MGLILSLTQSSVRQPRLMFGTSPLSVRLSPDLGHCLALVPPQPCYCALYEFSTLLCLCAHLYFLFEKFFSVQNHLCMDCFATLSLLLRTLLPFASVCFYLAMARPFQRRIEGQRWIAVTYGEECSKLYINALFSP